MNLTQLRARTRRFVQDTAGVEWTDAEIDEALNIAYYELQTAVQAVNPEAIISWDTIDLTAGESWYPKPPTFGIIQVALDMESTGKYTKLIFKNYEDIKDLAGDSTYATERGDWIGIFPAPDSSVTDGIEVMHRPMDTLVDDTDVPKLKLPLHVAICLQAKIYLLGDTNEESSIDEKKLSMLKEMMPLMYMGTIDENFVISPRGL